MRSIRTRLRLAGMICVLATGIIVACAGIIGTLQTVSIESDLVIKEIAKERSQALARKLNPAERDVSILQEYILRQIGENQTSLEDPAGQAENLDEIRQIAETLIRNTVGALSIYYCRMPENGSTEGVYIVKSIDGNCADYPFSDPDMAGKITEIAWNEVPLQKRGEVWLWPHQEEDVGRKVMSCVAPVIYGERQIGVVGVDISLDLVLEQLNVQCGYEDSYAFLTDAQGNIIYHPDFEEGISALEFAKSYRSVSNSFFSARAKNVICNYRWEGRQRQALFNRLENGMYVGVSILSSEVRRPVWRFVLIAVAALCVEGVVTCLIMSETARYYIKSIQELTEVMGKLTVGDLDVSIRRQTYDELGVLTESIQDMADELKKRVNSLNDFARRDELTSLFNKAAYEEQVKLLTKEIEEGRAQFSVAVLDVNSLKHMNDTYGHDAGDFWIMGAAKAIERAFGHSRVYRIGGDEFAAIFEPKGRKHFDGMFAEFQKEIESFNNREDKIYTERLQIACGLADFDAGTDREYMDVFRRADGKMYENKQFLKQKINT